MIIRADELGRGGFFATDASTVTPSDSTVLAPTSGIYVGVAGVLVVTMASGNTVTFTGIPAGFHRISVTKVLATGTTATGIVAMY